MQDLPQTEATLNCHRSSTGSVSTADFQTAMRRSKTDIRMIRQQPLLPVFVDMHHSHSLNVLFPAEHPIQRIAGLVN